mmetsp:Transcript_20853/g.43296  ORF Transcript_20853/g.43296 Transcript_20853/m.43296 type:complete len:105 (-) Transcript_20853:430-744(-)
MGRALHFEATASPQVLAQERCCCMQGPITGLVPDRVVLLAHLQAGPRERFTAHALQRRPEYGVLGTVAPEHVQGLLLRADEACQLITAEEDSTEHDTASESLRI